MKRLNKIIVCLGGVLVFSMGLNFSVQTIYAQENVAIVVPTAWALWYWGRSKPEALANRATLPP